MRTSRPQTAPLPRRTPRSGPTPRRACRGRARLASLALALCAVALLGARTGRAAADHRLDRDVVPTAEALDLTLDPNAEGYVGTATIGLDVRSAVESFVLHARELDLRRVELEDGGGRVRLRWGLLDGGRLRIETLRPLKPGPAALFVSFANDYDRRANALYRFDHEGRAYLATQFEAIAAREAFPCWDEPEFKIPWDVTLRVPAASRAIANTSPAEARIGGGTRVVKFRRTRALPSYLLAFAVGPYETTPVSGLSTPVRIVTVRGGSHFAAPAAQVARRVLPALERWFGQRQPYDKLDLIALPEYVGGAMENAGAITFHDRLLLHDPAAFSAPERRRLTVLMAHEMSHLWFGDLVTMAWWDDLWLNESFATLVADLVTESLLPSSRSLARPVFDVQRAFARDATAETRAIRGAVDANDNPDLLFDEISYTKGASVLRMLLGWIGESRFRAGVRAYLAAHEDGSAVADDLWDALGREAGFDVRPMARAFTERPGAPQVDVTLTGGSRLRLVQHRWQPGRESATSGRWPIPVVLLARTSDGLDTLRVMLAAAETTLALPRAARWVHPNADEGGYYRWTLDGASLEALFADAAELSPREQAGLPPALGAMLRAGVLGGEAWVAALRSLGAAPRGPALATALAAAAGDLRASFADEANASAVAATIRAMLTLSARAFAVAPRAAEDAAITEARPEVWRVLGDAGEDSSADARFRGWADALIDRRPGGPPASIEGLALAGSAWRGDVARWVRTRAALAREADPARRGRWLEALASFRAPPLAARTLELVRDTALSVQDVDDLLDGVGADPGRRDLVAATIEREYGVLARRMPSYAVAALPQHWGGCSPERLARAQAFFADSARRVPGTLEELAKLAAAVDACAALRARAGASVNRGLNATH